MENREWKSFFVRILPAAPIVLLLLRFSTLAYGQVAHATTKPSPDLISKNITHSIDQLAINPRLIENGAHVLFLIFSGDPDSPHPWDYKLSRCDRDGNAAYFLTSSGVLDYNVVANERAALVLMAIPSLHISAHPEDYAEIKDWELWYLHLDSEEKQLLESSNNQPLSDGYKILGLANLPNGDKGQLISNSPQKTNKISIQRKPNGFDFHFYYSRFDEDGNQHNVFQTEAWQSYHDSEWWPDIVWLNESRFLTLRFQSLFNEAFPQSEGLFSIVEIDFISGAAKDLYSDFSVKPFPRLAVNPDGSSLFFQRFGNAKDVTELWKLNLKDGAAEKIYTVRGELGESRFASDGKSIVFTEVTDNHFDIIRLDLDRNSIENVVGR